MTWDEMLDGFEEKCDNICDICERCEVCGGLMHDEFGRLLKREHMECRRILAMERGCDY